MRWLQTPTGSWPLVRIETADAARIGSKRNVAMLSAESASKQLRNHPDLTAADYAMAQSVVDSATHKVRQDARRLIFVKEVEGARGYVLVVKAVWENDELYIVSYRRLSNDAARRDRDIRNILAKES